MSEEITKLVAVKTTDETIKEVDKTLIDHRDSVDMDVLKECNHRFLSKSALCHAVFVRFSEDPEETLKYLNLK